MAQVANQTVKDKVAQGVAFYLRCGYRGRDVDDGTRGDGERDGSSEAIAMGKVLATGYCTMDGDGGGDTDGSSCGDGRGLWHGLVHGVATGRCSV